MSQWLLKKKHKKRTEHRKNGNQEFQEVITKRQKMPLHLSKDKIKLVPNATHLSSGRESLKYSKTPEYKETMNEENIYNEPWDLQCQSLKYKGENCCACSASSSCNSTPKSARKNRLSPKRTYPKESFPHKISHISKTEYTHQQTKDKDYFAIDCEISNSSDESDYYEFLENIEQRLKIDNKKISDETLTKWETNFSHKSFCNKPPNMFYNGYNANCADEVIYNSGSDHSSGFYEIYRIFDNKNLNSSKEIYEMYSFPPDEKYVSHTGTIQQTCFSSSSIYQTGYVCKGNRLLGDLIQLNYEKQQLQ